MKLTKLYNEVLNEQEILYHGTDNKYDEFDLEQVGTGDGRSLGGWGIYLTNDYDVAGQYITGKGKIHKYQLRRANFFKLDDMLVGLGDDFLRAFENSDMIGEDDIEEFRTDYAEYEYDVTNKQVYEWLAYVLGSEKEASIFLRNMGFDGNKYQDKTNPDSVNYVVYDLSIIKKVHD